MIVLIARGTQGWKLVMKARLVMKERLKIKERPELTCLPGQKKSQGVRGQENSVNSDENRNHWRQNSLVCARVE